MSLLVSACATDDEGSTDAELGDNSPTTDAPVDTQEADVRPADADPADTTDDAFSESDSSETGSSGAWCGALDLSDEGDEIFQSLSTASNDELEGGLQRVEEITLALESAAPAAIADDVSFLSDYTEQLAAALVAADYDILDADLSGLDLERLDEVQSNLDAFTESACGRPFGGNSSGDDGTTESGTDDSFDPAAGTLREQLVEQFLALGLTPREAECLVAEADLTDEALLFGDEAATLALFEACDIPLSRLAELGG